MARFKKYRALRNVSAWTPFKRFTVGVNGIEVPGEFCYQNSRYNIGIEEIGTLDPFGTVWEMTIHRLDLQPIFDWRDVQLAKNELFGPEAQAVQVFPRESMLVDVANEYWFYVFPDGYVFPFQMKHRSVSNRFPDVFSSARQRVFAPEHMPADLHEHHAQIDAFQAELRRFSSLSNEEITTEINKCDQSLQKQVGNLRRVHNQIDLLRALRVHLITLLGTRSK